MKKERLDDIIFDSVARTLESMAFTEILPTDLELVATGDEYAVALNVSEPCSGRFQMIISRELLSSIVEAMLALPRNEIKEKILLDLVSELLNTIAGSVLSTALSDDTKFSLGLPKIIDADKSFATVSAMRWDFSVEETQVSISASGEFVEYL